MSTIKSTIRPSVVAQLDEAARYRYLASRDYPSPAMRYKLRRNAYQALLLARIIRSSTTYRMP